MLGAIDLGVAKQGPPKIEVPLSDDEFNKMMKKLFGEGYQA